MADLTDVLYCIPSANFDNMLSIALALLSLFWWCLCHWSITSIATTLVFRYSRLLFSKLATQIVLHRYKKFKCLVYLHYIVKLDRPQSGCERERTAEIMCQSYLLTSILFPIEDFKFLVLLAKRLPLEVKL